MNYELVVFKVYEHVLLKFCTVLAKVAFSRTYSDTVSIKTDRGL